MRARVTGERKKEGVSDDENELLKERGSGGGRERGRERE